MNKNIDISFSERWCRTPCVEKIKYRSPSLKYRTASVCRFGSLPSF